MSLPLLFTSCSEFFNTDNLYEVLGVSKGCTIQELKKGYHKRSLACHPDRAKPEEKKRATQKFQTLAQVHSILSDDARRAEYDKTGEMDQESSIDQDKDWEQYWHLLFPKITEKDIEEFAKNFKGSEEELANLKSAYLFGEGDMDTIMDQMMCSSYEDEPRFRHILVELIQDGDLPDFDSFSKESKKKKNTRIKKAKSEVKEAEEEAKKLKLGDDALMSLIAQRQASRTQQADSFFTQLEAKYGRTGSGGSGSKKGGKKSKR